jgi:hypothetical protein
MDLQPEGDELRTEEGAKRQGKILNGRRPENRKEENDVQKHQRMNKGRKQIQTAGSPEL